MVPSINTRPGRLLVHCAAAFVVALALPAYADNGDTETRDDKKQPFVIKFDNPCTPDDLNGEGEIRDESRTTTKKDGRTEFRKRTRIFGKPVGVPSLAIYTFHDDDKIIMRSNGPFFKFTQRRRIQGVPDRGIAADGTLVAAFFITHRQETEVTPTKNTHHEEPDLKCQDRNGREIDD